MRTRVITSGLHVSNVGIDFSLVFRGPASPFVGSIIGSTRATVRACMSGRMRMAVTARDGRTTHPRPNGVLPRIGGIVTMSSKGKKMKGSAITTGLTITLTGLNCGINLLSTSVFNPSIPGVFRIRSTHPCTRRINKHSLVMPMRGCNVGLLSVNFFMSPSRTAL